jgi:hypothetical protein
VLDMLKNKAVTLASSAIALSGATTLSSFLAGASFNDALEHYGWIEAAQLSSAVPGQFYVISDRNEIREPLCSLTAGDFNPQQNREPGIRFVNVLGETLPFPSRTPGTVKGPDTGGSYIFELSAFKRSSVPIDSLLDHNRQILQNRDLEALRKDLDDQHFAEVMRLESCANAIVTSLGQGLHVCQLTEVATDEAKDRPLGVTFASSCLTRQDDTQPQYLPELRHYPLWTKVKSALGLIDARFS